MGKVKVVSCPKCGDEREVSYATFVSFKSGKTNPVCPACRKAETATRQGRKVNCPLCNEEREVPRDTFNKINAGKLSGNCKKCQVKVSNEKKAKYEITCPVCKVTRDCAMSAYYKVKNGKSDGKCMKCFNEAKKENSLGDKRIAVCGSCGESREVSRTTFRDIQSGKVEKCDKCEKQRRKDEALGDKRVFECPSCNTVREIDPATLSAINQGRLTGRCHPCSIKYRDAKRYANDPSCGKPKKLWFTRCPRCKKCREIHRIIATRIIRGESAGLCRKCSSYMNGKKNVIPWNKGSNPNMKEDNRRKRAIYRRNNKEKLKLQYKKYYESNKEKVLKKNRANCHNRRALGVINSSIIDRLIEDQIVGGKLLCYLCNCNCESNYHVEHATPVSRGGTNDYENLWISCQTCNLSKSAKTLEEYIHIKILDYFGDSYGV